MSRVIQAKSLPHWKEAPLCDQLLGPLRTWTKTPWKQTNTSVLLKGLGTRPGQAATGPCKGSPAAHAALPRSILGYLLRQTNSPEPLLHLPCLAQLCPPWRSPHKGWQAGSPHRGNWWRNISQLPVASLPGACCASLAGSHSAGDTGPSPHPHTINLSAPKTKVIKKQSRFITSLNAPFARELPGSNDGEGVRRGKGKSLSLPAPDPPKYSVLSTLEIWEEGQLTARGVENGQSMALDHLFSQELTQSVPWDLLCKTLQGHQGQPRHGGTRTLHPNQGPLACKSHHSVDLWATIRCPTPSSDAACTPWPPATFPALQSGALHQQLSQEALVIYFLSTSSSTFSERMFPHHHLQGGSWQHWWKGRQALSPGGWKQRPAQVDTPTCITKCCLPA